VFAFDIRGLDGLREKREELHMRHLASWLFAGALAVALPAAASYHTFQIESIYSNADGSLQFLVLHEAAGMNGENLLAGHTLTSTHAGVTKTFPFPRNLPGGTCNYYDCTDSPTANKRVLIATQSLANLAIVAPDYIVPDRFFPTDGGTIVYAEGASQLNYNLLPIDGDSAMKADGTMVPNLAQNFSGANVAIPATVVTNVEFYNMSLDHYFVSALAPDIDALDTGRIAGWVRTGLSFHVYPSQAVGGALASPVCRILIPPPANSHFFSASPQECADTLAKFPTMEKETDAAYYIDLPTTTGPNAGACPTGLIPVYRVFNNRADGNHRYTTSTMVRDQMVAAGGTAEGYGNDAVIMCAPA
jgi:hypothetical protein